MCPPSAASCITAHSGPPTKTEYDVRGTHRRFKTHHNPTFGLLLLFSSAPGYRARLIAEQRRAQKHWHGEHNQCRRLLLRDRHAFLAKPCLYVQATKIYSWLASQQCYSRVVAVQQQ